MAIADEIAAKESVQVQQPLPHIQSVNSVSKSSNASLSSSGDSASKNYAVSPSSGGNSRVPVSLRQLRCSPSSPSVRQSNSYTCFSCGNANLEMLHVATVTQEGILFVPSGRME